MSAVSSYHLPLLRQASARRRFLPNTHGVTKQNKSPLLHNYTMTLPRAARIASEPIACFTPAVLRDCVALSAAENPWLESGDIISMIPRWPSRWRRRSAFVGSAHFISTAGASKNKKMAVFFQWDSSAKGFRKQDFCPPPFFCSPA